MVRLLMLKAARELNRRMAASSPKRTNRGIGQTAQVTTTKPLFTHIDRKFIGQLGLDVDLIVMRVPSARVVKGGFSEGQELGQMTITSDSTDPTSSVRSPAMARRNKVKPRATEN